jgi:predicted lipoprotein with Yx(FWY)xxD motif
MGELTAGRLWRKLGIAALVGGLLAMAAAPGLTASAAVKVHHPKFVVLSASEPGLGTILTTRGGLTLYTYTADTQDNSTVTGSLLTAWPPLLLPAGDVLTPGRGIVGLGTYKLSNGETYVTWQGLPLYTFFKDTGPHVVNGHGVHGFVVAFVALQKKH